MECEPDRNASHSYITVPPHTEQMDAECDKQVTVVGLLLATLGDVRHMSTTD